MSSGTKKKESRYTWLIEAKASHSQRMWAKFSYFTPHFLHKGLSSIPRRWRCLLRLLYPLRRPITTLDSVLLKDRSLTLVPRLGPEINSRSCLWVSPRSRQLAHYWLTNQRLSFFCVSRLETPRTGSGPRNPIAGPPIASSSAISLSRIPACPGTQYSPTACRVQISFKDLWHWWTTYDICYDIFDNCNWVDTVHIYTQTIHRTQIQTIHRTTQITTEHHK